jgi:hypothetical protein
VLVELLDDQRCWVHKTVNILDSLPLSVQATMKKNLREVYWAPNRASAEAAIDIFAEKYRAKYGRAVECLVKDREALLAFYDFPAEHWKHLRTTDEIDKSFLLRDLLFCISTGDRVAKSRARGCQPDRAAVIVAPHWRHPCAASRDHAAAIG